MRVPPQTPVGKGLDTKPKTWDFPTMSATAVREKRQVTLPQDVFESAGLKINDQVDWRFENGEIRGRKLVPQAEPKRVCGKLVRKGDAWVFELPKGYTLAPDAIEQAVREERNSRS